MLNVRVNETKVREDKVPF